MPTTNRKDYDVTKAKALYEEYTSSKASYNQLAKKYGISPQRVAFLIKDFKNKGLHEHLSLSASKDEREAYKNKAVTLREQGKHKFALDMLDEVIRWDEQNKNFRGIMDVLGHKKLAYTLMADGVADPQHKGQLLTLALACVEEALNMGKEVPDLPVGPVLTQYVHYAGLLLTTADLETAQVATKKRNLAIEYLDKALSNGFTGSTAHKAWPLSIKAKALHALGQSEQALDCLLQAQKMLYLGYEEELKLNDQAEMKIRVWSSGISLGLGKLLLETGKPLLAEVHFAAVITTPDPDGILVARKKEAKKLLASIVK